MSKKSAWDIPWEEFSNRILRGIYINPLIPKDIRSEIESISDLLRHSYFNSNFIDDAYFKAIIILEKVLRVRSKELNNGIEEKNLVTLFQWFFKNNYFETQEITELHQLRKIRNRKAHDVEIFKGNLNFLINIYAIFDLMNDVYEDVGLRMIRRSKTKIINDQFNRLFAKGFIVMINGMPYFGHFISVLFYNNKGNAEILNIRIARCKMSNVLDPENDRDNYELVNWNFSNNEFVGTLKNGEAFLVRPITESTHLEQFESWRNIYPAWDIALFDTAERECYQEKLRDFHKPTSI